MNQKSFPTNPVATIVSAAPAAEGVGGVPVATACEPNCPEVNAAELEYLAS